MSKARDKLKQWVAENPNGYLEMTLNEIAMSAGISKGSVVGHLYDIIADRDDCLPSDVQKRRDKAGFKQSPRGLSQAKIADIRRYYFDEGMAVKDIRYILKVSESTIRKYLQEDERWRPQRGTQQ